MSGEPNIRPMSFPELQTLVDWAAAEGWNPGLQDASLFWEIDRQGFVAMEVDGPMIGGGAIVRHSPNFGFMGLFIVAPEFRGQGLGRQLWQARRDGLLARLRPGATIGLDGVDAMVPFYARGGFRIVTRHRRFEFPSGDVAGGDESRIVPLGEVNWESVRTLDRQCFPADREEVLKSWFRQPEAVALAWESDGECLGYAVMRACRQGWKIGPLFAVKPEVAQNLLTACLRRAAEGPVYLDVPDNNPNAMELIRPLPGREVFGCVRMYLGPEPSLRNDWIYGISTLETG